MALRIPPTQALRAFEAVARTGSLTKAAEALRLTHGAISHQVKALEAIVGVPLVERIGRRIRTTEEGERLAGRVRAALADIADALREASERNDARLHEALTPRGRVGFNPATPRPAASRPRRAPRQSARRAWRLPA